MHPSTQSRDRTPIQHGDRPQKYRGWISVRVALTSGYLS